MRGIIQTRFNSIAALYFFQRHGEHAREKMRQKTESGGGTVVFLTLLM